MINYVKSIKHKYVIYISRSIPNRAYVREENIKSYICGEIAICECNISCNILPLCCGTIAAYYINIPP